VQVTEVRAQAARHPAMIAQLPYAV
jgi:hypothetical protein